MEEKKKIGKPLKFQSVEELKEKIEAYFVDCDNKKRPYNVTSLALWLDTTRETLTDYQVKDGYSDTVKRAKVRIQAWKEEQLYRNTQVAGVIFDLKNNYSNIYKDRHDVGISGEIEFVEQKNKIKELASKTIDELNDND